MIVCFVWPIGIAAGTVVTICILRPAMHSGTFSQDPNSHAVIIGGSVSSSVVRGVRVRTSMSTKWHDPKLVLITDLQKKIEEIEMDFSECLWFQYFYRDMAG